MAKEQAILGAATRLPNRAQSRARRRLHRRAWAAQALLVLLADCAAPTPPPQPLPAPPAPQTRPFAPMPPAPADWRDAPVTPGDWHWQHDGGDSTAWFGTRRAAPLALLQCPRASGTVSLAIMAPSPAGAFSASGLTATITTSTQTRTMQATRVAAAGGGSGAVLRLNAGDALLDAMAFSRRRFMVAIEGMAPITLPSWPEVSRVIEDCRAP